MVKKNQLEAEARGSKEIARSWELEAGNFRILNRGD